jgi:hypothetical protein
MDHVRPQLPHDAGGGEVTRPRRVKTSFSDTLTAIEPA